MSGCQDFGASHQSGWRLVLFGDAGMGRRWQQQAVLPVDGIRMFKILNIERFQKVICFVLACTKRPFAPNTLMVDNDRQLCTRVANCTTMPHFVAPTYSRYI